MLRSNGPVRRHGVTVVALALLAGAYGFARLPRLPEAEREALASRFAFTRLELATLEGRQRQTIRAVHPSLERIAAWISSVGASVALHDLDGDGLPNDVCLVDTAIGEVVVAPAPGTGARFAPFALDPAPLAHDRTTTAPMGCLPGDLDEDGGADLLVYYWGRPPVAFLRRGATDVAAAPPLGRDAFVAREIAPGGERWYTNALTRADVDGDGHADLVVGNYFPDGARILDADGDGRESMQHSMSRADNAGHNRLLLWVGAEPGPEPTVRYRVVEEALPGRAEIGWTLALGAADLDGDLLPELYVGNDFGPDRLLHNRSRPGEPRFVPLYGERTLLTPRSKVLGKDSFKGMGVDFADVDGDGHLDIYVSNIAEEYALEESHFVWRSTGEGAAAMARGVAPFVDASEPLGLSRSGWGWDSRWGDFDNDGTPEAVQATGFIAGRVDRWPELHEIAMGNDELLRNPYSWPEFRHGDDLSGDLHNPFFVRSASGRYFDLAGELGLAEPMVTRGIATADVDGDGDLDFAVANQWARSYLYRNDGPAASEPGTSLVLRLERPVAPGSHRGTPAIGAVATLELADGRRVPGLVDGGNGHSGARSPEIHFGLGSPSSRPLSVHVAWRDADGVVHRELLRLPPGRHRVLLGTSQTPDSRKGG